MTHREMLQAVIELCGKDGIRVNHSVNCGYTLHLRLWRDPDNCPGCRAVVLLRDIEAELAKEPEPDNRVYVERQKLLRLLDEASGVEQVSPPDDRVYVYRQSLTHGWIVMRHGKEEMKLSEWSTADEVLKAVCQSLDVAESKVVFQ